MPEPPFEETLVEVARHLRRCRSVLFITGAGLSADSGLPTYRGIGGLYEDAHTDEGIPIEDALSGVMMQRRPDISWKYLAQIAHACRGARHNRGHEIIAAMEAHFPRAVTLTQNVDGFHHAAGSRNIIDIHGDLHELICTACAYRRRVPDYLELDLPPSCPDCGALVRPDVVLFGEMLPPAKFDRLCRELDQGFDIVFSIGTTSVFPYIAAPVWQVGAAGGVTVEINPGRTQVSDDIGYRLAAPAAATLTALWRACQTPS